MDVVKLGPRDRLGYRRPTVTTSYDDLLRRGLPEVLLTHAWLPEGVTICDVEMFAAVIEEAYHTNGLFLDPPDEHGNQVCRSLVGNGQWEWKVASPALPPELGLPMGPVLWLTLSPDSDGQRIANIATYIREEGRRKYGAVLATFPIDTRPGVQFSAASSVELEPLMTLGGRSYRRPPATASFDELRQRGLPTVLFVNRHLPEGVTVCDLRVFAAMIEEAYHTPGALHMLPELDAHGNEQCTGIGSTQTWDWLAVSESELTEDGERQMSSTAEIDRILFAPEAGGNRVCTLELKNGNGGRWLQSNYPVTFPVAARGTVRGE